MKKFKDILAMTQPELKSYLQKFLISNEYSVASEDGFLFAIGTEPVMVTAHMDRHPCQEDKLKEIHIVEYENEGKIETRWSSPEGICGDDRCGVWIIMNLIKRGHRPTVLFCEDEEIGCVGSHKFTKSKYINEVEVNYMIQIDRRGSNDCVFYSNANKEFQKWIEDATGRKTAIGSCSDISYIMPATMIAGVNFSCGYYNEHSRDEYIVIEEVNQTLDMIDELLSMESEPWEYEEKKKSFDYGFSSYDWSKYFDGDYESSYSKKERKPFKKTTDYDKYITLTVYLSEEAIGWYELDTVEVKGETKPECWMNLFMEYEDLCFSCITDYEYS